MLSVRFFALPLLFVTLFFAHTPLAFATLYSCIDRPAATLNYSSADCTTWTSSPGNEDNPACNFTPTNGSFTQPVNTGNTCTNTRITCTSPANVTAVDSLFYDSSKYWPVGGNACVNVPAPTGVSATCNSSNQIIISGTPPSANFKDSVATYPVRVDDTTAGPWQYTGTCNGYIGGGDYCADTGSSFPQTINGAAGHTYNIWVHTLYKGAWSSLVSTSATCPAAPAPTITTNTATAITSTGATLNGTGNPNGVTTTASFRWGTSNVACSSLPNSVTATTPASGALGSGSSGVTFSYNLTGLSAGTTYYFCARGVSAGGTTDGAVLQFTAATLPDLTAGAVSPTTATVGSLVALSSTITNQGSASTGAGFTVLFQIASDASGTGAATLGTYSRSTAVAAGGTFSATYSTTPTSPGTVYIRSCADKTSGADANGVIGEGTNEGNNCGPWTSVVVSCPAGQSWNGSACVVSTNAACNLPWGGTIAHGNSVTAYQSTTATFPTTCADIDETRTCNNGTLSGSYTNQSCSQRYTITASAGANGSITPSGVTTLNSGGSQSYTITPSSGYTISTVSVDGSPVSATSPYNFTNVTSNRTISATFSATAGPTATITADSCVVPAWSSSCQASVSWTSANLTTTLSVRENGTQFSNSPSAAPGYWTRSRTPVAPNTYTAVHNGVTLDTKVGSATCEAGTSWVSGSCQPAPMLPDFTFGNVSPVTASAGASQSFSATFTNLGPGTAASSINYLMQQATAANGGGTITDEQTGTVANTSAGGTRTASEVHTFPTSGTYSLRFCADKLTGGDSGLITEVNEDNNCGGWTNITVGAAIPSATLTVANCTIAIGASSCRPTVSWSSSNVPAVRAIHRNTSPSAQIATNLAESGSLTSGQRPTLSAPGSYTFSFRGNGTTYDTDPSTASCAAGSTWRNGICERDGATLTFTVPSCVIAVNTSTCESSVSWTSTNLTLSPSVRQNGIEFSTSATSTGTSRTLAYGSGASNTFTAVHNGTTLDTEIGTATCAADSAWDGSMCAPTRVVSVGPLIATPDTVNYNGSSVLSWSQVVDADSCSITGGSFTNRDVGTGSSGTLSTGALTTDTLFTLTCLGNNGPATSQVVVRVASGDISAAPTSCTIAANESSCFIGITWTTNNMENPNMTDGAGNILSTNPNGTSVQQTVTYGNNIFAIKNGSITHDSVLVNAVCDAASKWNGSVCSPATGTINSTFCVIDRGSPTCSINVTWSTTNTVSTVTVTRPYAGNSVFATGVSGSAPGSFPAGTFNLEVRHGSTVLATGSYTAVCAAGSLWNGTTCEETTNVTVGLLYATPQTVNYGRSTTLTWNGVANATGCTISGGTFTGEDVGTNESGSIDTGNLSSNTTYTLTCQGSGGPKTAQTIVLVASGSISATPLSCIIPSGERTCSTALSWTTTNMSSPNVVDQTGKTVSTNPTGNAIYRSVPEGTTTFSLRNGSFVHDSVSIIASCEVGTAWDGEVCATANGTINSSTCVIAAGGSTCNAQVIWSMGNAVETVTVTGPVPASTLRFTGQTGNSPLPLPYGTNYLNLRHGTTVVATGTYIATCAGGTLWNGTLCGLSGISGDLVLSSHECIILTGQSSCSVNGTWTTSGATTPSLYNETTAQIISSLANQSTPTALTVRYGGARFILREGVIPLDFENVTTRCAIGGWDSVGGTCANPSVLSAIVTGQYYSATGNIAIQCSNANRYRVVLADTGAVIRNNLAYTPGSTVDVAVTLSGNYAVYCLQGNYMSMPVVRYYNASPPPSPTITLTATPRTVSKASDSTVSWSIQHPRPSCSLVARTICASGVCSPEQRSEETSINAKITGEYVDTSNISGALAPRTILNSIRYIPSDRLNTDWKTEGSKTFNLNYSTEFVLSCGDSVSQAVRIQVTRTGEQ